MEPRQITPRYHVSPQITSEDAAAIKAAGFVRVICNRPDMEVPPELQAETVGAAMRAVGLEFFELPISSRGMDAETVAAQTELRETAAGPVLAYCASGTRCTIVWALGESGGRPAEEILSLAAAAGYDLGGLRSALES